MKYRDLAMTIRESVPPKVRADYYLALAMGKDARLKKNEAGDLEVKWDETGNTKPTLETRQAAIKWLLDNGYGKVPDED